ncbi:MAG: tRNA (N6-isopentenyl adenosine(37)-C2)-methylthiotransferase MiaB [Myxococcales bacterium]|nr:tRNA (N6-isopentenyl adenosine(37)-C2)-methylthiotransferase MiaB [Myxococcales bacterium]MCB9581059.1 tRNA (N6-isopentenyl adenosine(37)-C2)-methylthiotransferase MiaB [Polyangiaceae bacterium]
MPTYALVTFGCQMNQHDSERMTEVLRGAGFVQAEEPEGADVVLLNTCSVREKAEQKLRSEVGRLGLLKRRRPELLIGVAGCVAQQEGERLIKKLPQIDLVLGPDNIGELPALLRELEGGGPPRVRTVFDLDSPRFLQAEPVPGKQTPSAYVTVMKGCDERCTFCIVPHTRGPERYRAASEVTDEIARLVEAGAREVTLLGQTVNSYRDPSRSLSPAPGADDVPWTHTHPTTARQDESEFSALVRAIAERVPELRRLRYTSPHPRHLTMSLIRAHQELPVLARHVHLPVQSGSDAMLRRMLRRYSVAEYHERVDALRERVPGVTLSTDVIVGFPGETRQDFAQTLELVERVGFTGLFGFKYSVRPFTRAERLADDVSEEDKSARLAELFELSEALRQRHLESLVGSTQDVLVEGPGKQGGYSGRTEQNEIVHLGAASDPSGEILRVRIVQAFKNSLVGEAVDPARRASFDNARSTERRQLPVV